MSVIAEGEDRRRTRLCLVLLLLIAFALRLAVGLHAPNVYYPDEIFQTQEVGHRLAFGNGVVAWEWRDGIRNYVVPFVLSLIMRLTAPLGPGSSGYLFAITACSSALSLTVVWFCFEWARRVGGFAAALIAGSAACVWFLILFFSPKTFTEVLATDFLLPGILIGQAQEPLSRKQLYLSGFLLGLAAALRPQFAPTVLLVAVWICWPDFRRRCPALVAGLCTPILLFGVVDAFTLSYPFASFVRYVWVNVGQGKSKQFGTEPWYFFINKLCLYCWPFLIPAIFGLRRSPLLGWVLFVLVGSHSVLAHKEFRFIFPAVPLLIALFGIGCADWVRALQTRMHGRSVMPFVYLAVVLVTGLSALLGLRFTHWHDSAGKLAAEDVASRDGSICGIGIFGMHWAWTGGYTHVHRDIPMILPDSPEDLAREAGQFNMLLTPGTIPEPPNGFTMASCRYGTCVYRRPGSCQPAGEDEINAKLRRIGQ